MIINSLFFIFMKINICASDLDLINLRYTVEEEHFVDYLKDKNPLENYIMALIAENDNFSSFRELEFSSKVNRVFKNGVVGRVDEMLQRHTFERNQAMEIIDKVFSEVSTDVLGNIDNPEVLNDPGFIREISENVNGLITDVFQSFVALKSLVETLYMDHMAALFLEVQFEKIVLNLSLTPELKATHYEKFNTLIESLRSFHSEFGEYVNNLIIDFRLVVNLAREVVDNKNHTELPALKSNINQLRSHSLNVRSKLGERISMKKQETDEIIQNLLMRLEFME